MYDRGWRRYTLLMSALRVERHTVEEYLALDRAAEVPGEYHDGEMFSVEAATLRHSAISLQAKRRLTERLEGKPCRVVEEVRLRIGPTKFVYPDIMVVCGQPATTDEYLDTITNPKVIVEILSPSTEDYDYGTKFELYRRLPSFEEYLLIAQDRPRVEVFRKMSGERWVLSTYRGLDAEVALETVDVALRLAELYVGAGFPAAGE